MVIDFPQMISTEHPKAKDLFERDINSLLMSFKRHQIEGNPLDLSQQILETTKVQIKGQAKTNGLLAR